MFTCSKVQGTIKFFSTPKLNGCVLVSGIAYCYNSDSSHWSFYHLLDAVFWHPFASALCASSSIGCEGFRKTSLRFIMRMTKWLQCGNSVCNPIVYGLRNREFQQTFHKILLGLCGKKAPLSDNRNNANGNPHLQQQAPNRLPLASLIDRRESNRREFGIQSRRIQPVSLQFVDTLHGVSPANDVSTCPVELCNPAFEDGKKTIGIYRLDAELFNTRL